MQTQIHPRDQVLRPVPPAGHVSVPARLAAANSCHDSGIPLSAWTPPSAKLMPEPRTRAGRRW